MSCGWRLGTGGCTRVAVVVVLLIGRTAAAQTDGKYEVGAGVRFVGPESLGHVDVNETTASGGSFRLFTAASTLEALIGFDARFGVRVTRALRIEATGSYGASDLKIALNSDVEGAAAVNATERVSQFTIEGAAVFDLRRGQTTGPFVAAGAGYVRALHEERILVDQGLLWHAGGGVNLRLTSHPGSGLGLRLDARALFQHGILNDGMHVSPAFGASAFVRF